MNCYICGVENARFPLMLKNTFTAHSRCKSIESDKLCDRCFDCIEGKYKQCWYTKEDSKVSKLWGRNWSWLISESESYPKFKKGKEGLLEVYDLPTRQLIREWVVKPPLPPFTICIAVSGQKHTYPFSQVSHSRSLIPILFEEDIIYWQNADTKFLTAFESLMTMGFNKTEITSGDYSPNKLIKVNIDEFSQYENVIATIRNTLKLNLIAYISIPVQ